MDGSGRWIGRAEALERLGVKTQTLYAYVSRGRISARADPSDPRRSLYAVSDIGRLSGELIDGETDAPIHDGPAPARGQALVEVACSGVVDARMVYRGQDAADLSETATLEAAARLLWGGEAHDDPFARLKPRLALGGVTVRKRLFATLGRRAEEDAPAGDRTIDALRHEAASVLDEIVDAIAGVGPRLHFHQRLGRGWKVVERDNPLIRRALVLAADQPFDAAAFATRIAADGGASPAAATLAGLSAWIGSTEMAEAAVIQSYVHEARRDPAGAAVRRWTAGAGVPGFDPAWTGGDPRARALIAAAALPADLAAVAREGEGVAGAPPSLSLAIALVARRLDLARDGACDLLLIGRLVGLLGHALDQRSSGAPIQSRMRYVGPRPGAV